MQRFGMVTCGKSTASGMSHDPSSRDMPEGTPSMRAPPVRQLQRGFSLRGASHSPSKSGSRIPALHPEVAMSLPSPHEALIYLMVITSAADREMTDLEMARIGNVLKTWPVFQDFDDWKLIRVAQECQQRLQAPDGLAALLSDINRALPARLHDTAYAAAFEVATVDLEMRMEELRVLELIRDALSVEQEAIDAIERATKARHRTLT
jgi:hypothetical protein